MASVKPLRLKTERASLRLKLSEYVVDVAVETSVPHLDLDFTYELPEKFRNFDFGVYIKIDFNGHSTRGIIVNKRLRNQSDSNLKPVLGAIYAEPLVTKSQWQLITETARVYAVSRSTIMNFALPNPIRAKERSQTTSYPSKPAPDLVDQSTITGFPSLESLNSKRSSIVLTSPTQNYLNIVAEFAQSIVKHSSVLILVPDARDIEALEICLKNVGISPRSFTSDQSRTENFTTYKCALSSEKTVFLGTRTAIWLPINGPTIILNDVDPSFTERKAPYFHVRDVALLRSDIYRQPVYFVGPAPSLDIVALLEKGVLGLYQFSLKVQKQNLYTVAAAPDTFHQSIRYGLKKGSVLIQVAEKGYYNTVLCAKCRNHPLCECGGRYRTRSDKSFLCSLCGKNENHLSCRWCQSSVFVSLRKGSERIAQEIGKAFPRVPILISTRDNRVSEIDEKCIVISTAGVEPWCRGGYQTIVFLDCEMVLNRPLMRSEEFARLHWRSALSQLASEGQIFFSLPHSHREVQAMISGQYLAPMTAELVERHHAKLTPSVRVIRISGVAEVINQLSKTLSIEFPVAVTVQNLPNEDERTLFIRSAHRDFLKVMKALGDVQRLRSAKKQALLNIMVDPIDL